MAIFDSYLLHDQRVTGRWAYYHPLVNQHNHYKSPCSMEKSTINGYFPCSYVDLPESNHFPTWIISQMKALRSHWPSYNTSTGSATKGSLQYLWNSFGRHAMLDVPTPHWFCWGLLGLLTAVVRGWNAPHCIRSSSLASRCEVSYNLGNTSINHPKDPSFRWYVVFLVV